MHHHQVDADVDRVQRAIGDAADIERRGGGRDDRHPTVDRDEHPRADLTADKLTALRAVRLKVDAESTVTAGNASGQNDGAAMCVITALEHAERIG